MLISKVCKSRGAGIMVMSKCFCLFVTIDKSAVDNMEGRVRGTITEKGFAFGIM